LRRPNLLGDLDSVLEFQPDFRGSLRGYERSRVDSYVTWAERELQATRRAADELATRFGVCAAELERAREELARSEAGREARRMSERVARILELAAEEAAELRAAGAAEAEELVAGAREYVASMLRHAREVEDAASAAATEAERSRQEAAAALTAAAADAERARQEGAAELAAAAADGRRARDATAAELARLTQEAAAARSRLDAESAARRAEAEEKARRQREQEAAAAAEGVAAARREIEELNRRRDVAAESLRQLTDRVGDALAALASGLPIDVPQLAAASAGAPAPRNEVAQPNVVAGRPDPARHSRWWAGTRSGRPSD
jgi:chromosome segregation ATPase